MTSDTLEAGNNANNIETFGVNNLSDKKSFLGSFFRKAKTVSTSQINGYFGWDGLLLNITNISRYSWFITYLNAPNWVMRHRYCRPVSPNGSVFQPLLK